MPEVIKTRNDADFLGLVPHLLGFHPQNSVVLIGFQGKRTHGALRLDLPDVAIGFKKVATFALGTMSKIAGLEAMAIVVFTDESVVSAVPHSEFARILTDRISRAGLGIKGAWCLGGDGWASYEDPSHEVRSLNEIELSDAALSQQDALGSSRAELPPATEADKRRAAADLAHYWALAVADERDTYLAPLDDVAFFVESVLHWDEHEMLELGSLLLFLVQHPNSRDATMVQWASSMRAADPMWENENGSTEGADLMLGRGQRPKRERVERAIAVMVQIASIAGPTESLAPLCMLAWMNWAIGQGSIAGQFIDMALEVDPEYGLATLLNLMMSNGYLPPWAFDVPDEVADRAELAT